jgi:monoterpene epsilon-lactone hydrolase
MLDIDVTHTMEAIQQPEWPPSEPGGLFPRPRGAITQKERETMASNQARAVTKLYESWLSTPAEDDLIQGPQHWDILTSEPGGVDYLEIDAAGVPAMWVVPHGAAADRVLLCIHGGGFISGSIYTHRKLFAHLAKAAGTRALLVGYRILPEGVHPGPVDDVVAAYRWLLDQGFPANRIAFTGDSAGGGLSVTAQLVARDRGMPVPAAALPMSPWVDMAVTGETIESNSHKDVLFNRDWITQMAQGFLGGTDPRDPYVSPIYADLTGISPLYIQVGDYELLLDDSRRLAAQAGAAGVQVVLDVVPEMQHTFEMMAGRAPEADEAIARMANWVHETLGLAQADHVASTG